jgi:CBS-domain-containing membrane protein
MRTDAESQTVTAATMMNRHLVTVDDQATLGLVEGQMTLQNVRHVAVLDGDRHLVGVVSRGDVLRGRQKGEHQFVRDHMTRRLWTIRPERPAVEAVQIMIDHGVGCVPVVDAERHLLGILSETDFLEVARQTLAGSQLTQRR